MCLAPAQLQCHRGLLGNLVPSNCPHTPGNLLGLLNFHITNLWRNIRSNRWIFHGELLFFSGLCLRETVSFWKHKASKWLPFDKVSQVYRTLIHRLTLLGICQKQISDNLSLVSRRTLMLFSFSGFAGNHDWNWSQSLSDTDWKSLPAPLPVVHSGTCLEV